MTLDMLQVMSPEGSVDAKDDPAIPAEDLLRLYRLMVLNRQLDDRMMKLQRQGRIGFYLQSMGEEATHIGSAYALQQQDWIIPCYREPGPAFLRGFPLVSFVCQLMGNSGDMVKGRQMPNHYCYKPGNYTSVSSPVGTQITQAVGVAWAAKIKKDPVVALVYFGEGATSQGDFHVALNFAGVYRAPVIFICRNNGYAISTSRAQQTASETIAIKAKAYGIPGVRVDGNDLFAVVKASREAADRARSGQGPTLIEAVTYRQGAHSSSDDPRVYRPDDELQQELQRDPIVRLRKHMEARKLWDARREEKLQEEVKAEIISAVEEAETYGQPPVETLFDDVFSSLTPQLEEQKAYLLDYLKRNPRSGEVK